MFSNRLSLMALSLASLLVLTLASSSLAATDRNGTAEDRPDWQRNNSAQNVFENHMAWLDYTNDIDAEFVETDDRDYAIELLGEAFSLSAEYMIHLDAFYPSAKCANEFWHMSHAIVSEYAFVYGAMYYNLTAEVGEPIDVEALFEEVDVVQNYYTEYGISQKCWNKLDA